MRDRSKKTGGRYFSIRRVNRKDCDRLATGAPRLSLMDCARHNDDVRTDGLCGEDFDGGVCWKDSRGDSTIGNNLDGMLRSGYSIRGRRLFLDPFGLRRKTSPASSSSLFCLKLVIQSIISG